jgi:adenosylmethionine-8-amino-7-oxononanoate aminotransferase
VADEVISGFGRTGHMFARGRYGLRPHMLLTAQGISSGAEAELPKLPT